MRRSQGVLRRSGRVGLACVLASAIVLAGAVASASAATLAMTLSSTTGPSGGGNTITATVAATAAAPSPFPAGTTPAVQFQYVGTGASSCSATAQVVTQIAGSGTAMTAGVQTVDPDMVKRISTTKLAIQVPSSAYPALDGDGNPSTVNPGGLVLVDPQKAAKWNICVYDSASTTSSTLLATASYTLVVRPSITSIIPASSPAGGGQSITVNGVGFGSVGSQATTGSIGGVALTNVVVASTGNSLTAITGARAAGTGLILTVNTPGGSVGSDNPDNDSTTNDDPILFTYSNGITITPNTAVAGAKVSVDINGAGFSRLTFNSGTPTDNQAHIFLVKDAYAADSNRGVAECTDVLSISDTELVCTLDLSFQLSPTDSTTVPDTPVGDGAYVLTVVADGATDAGADANPTIFSSGAVFAVAPY